MINTNIEGIVVKYSGHCELATEQLIKPWPCTRGLCSHIFKLTFPKQWIC